MKRRHQFIICCFLVCGCTNVRHAVPERLLYDARVYGMGDIRAFDGIPSDSFKKDFMELLEQELAQTPSFLGFKEFKKYSMLAISGGGANGAYCAGLLAGWSKSGTRPEFKIITGISTGAIIAPFAFLGSRYDDTLKELYTQYSTRDIMRMRLSGNSLASLRPLERLIEQYIDAPLLKELAVEYHKGRRLYVGTTSLDAQRLVIWDMGKIAAAGDERSLKLFRKIILASASIPIVFPPVYLEVEADNTKYDEMHVDGGISKQVFFLQDVMRGFDTALKEKGIDVFKIQYDIYVIRNAPVYPSYSEVPNKISAIAERSVKVMSNAQSVGDLYQLYLFTTDGKGDFNLAYIPAEILTGSKEFFDPVVMRELFELGFIEAANGYPWRKSPPGL